MDVTIVDPDFEIGGGDVVESLPQRIGHTRSAEHVDAHGPPRDARGSEEGEDVVERGKTGSQRRNDALTAALTPKINPTRLGHGR